MPGYGSGSGGGNGGTSAVTRNTLRQQIADALRDEVLAGRMQPGQEFTVKEIAEQYGVSATPVREALVDLSAQGLLDSDQHRGFKVHQFSVDDYRTMVETRSMVVDAIFGRLAEHRPCPPAPQALLSVHRRAEEASRAARTGDLDILIGYDLRFWRELAALAANRYLCDFLHRLRVQAWVFAVPFLRADPELSEWLWSGHQDVVDAVNRGDTACLRAVISAYNDHALAWADRLERRARPERPDHRGEDRPGEDRPRQGRTGQDRPGQDRWDRRGRQER
ncbi:GntR family transcriptional regulator [Streptomyces peucetius]|uniref:GntR family transcriptional regulator n=1 Tax=Streptomyces peucetius TaxID=1950 RepID=A0ABY6IBZ0_STRPE|nr:GntR family transcriptional regulator [Streptomyces peucetius]UYQ63484.1 GntR family transcriptional regulator [Streptomyces peucetius]